MNARSSLDLASTNATGTRSVPLAAQSTASPDVTTVSGSERHRLRRVDFMEPVAGKGEVEITQKLIEPPFAKHQKTQRIVPMAGTSLLALLDRVLTFRFLGHEHAKAHGGIEAVQGLPVVGEVAQRVAESISIRNSSCSN